MKNFFEHYVETQDRYAFFIETDEVRMIGSAAYSNAAKSDETRLKPAEGFVQSYTGGIPDDGGNNTFVEPHPKPNDFQFPEFG